MTMPINTHSVAAISHMDQDKVGFGAAELLILVPTLIQLLSVCKNRNNPDQTPKQVAEASFDEVTQTFSADVIRSMRPRVRQAAKRKGLGRVSAVQADELSRGILMQAKAGRSNSTAALCAQFTEEE